MTIFPKASLLFLTIGGLLLPRAAQAQTKEAVQQQIAAGTCACVDKKLAARPAGTPLGKEEAHQMLTQCMMGEAGKNLKGIQTAYGTNAFADNETMRQLGREVGAQMMQTCPSFTTVSLALAGKDQPTNAATTGQTTGTLGALRGTELALLEVQVSKTEKAEFAWLHRFAQADELLPQLARLRGRPVRIEWQEVELLQPGTGQYQRVREITGLTLQ